MAEEKSEIEEMLDGMLPGTGDEPPPEEPPPVEAPPEEPPVEEPPAEPPPEEPPVEEPPAEPPPEEPPPEEPPVEEPPVEEPPVEEPLSLEKQNKLLLERIDYLSTPEHLRVKPTVEPPPTEPPPAAAPVAPPTVPPAEEPPPKPAKPVDFVKGRPIEDFDSPEGLNAILNEVATQARASGDTKMVDVVVERILRSIPQLVAGQIVQQNAINEVVKEFYDANKDLLGAKRTVAMYSNEVHSEHPDWEVQKVFNEAGGRTRKVLGLKADAVKPKPKRNPAFAKQRGARKGGDEEGTDLQKDIDDMME